MAQRRTETEPIPLTEGEFKELCLFLTDLDQSLGCGHEKLLMLYADGTEALDLALLRQESVNGMGIRMGAVIDEAVISVLPESAFWTAGGTIKANVSEVTRLYYHYEDNPGSDDFAAFGVPHVLELSYEDSSYRIIGDSFDEREFTGIASSDYLEPVLRPSPVGLECFLESNARILRSLGHREVSFQYSADSLNDALWYAKQYCGVPASLRHSLISDQYIYLTDECHTNYYNTADYPNVCAGADCVNFVSQILYYAGLTEDTGLWYYSVNNPYWVGVNEFLSLWPYTIESVNSAYGNVFPGNPVFWRGESSNNNDGSPNHIMFCVGYDSAGVPVLCAHTRDAFRVPITLWINEGHSLETMLIAGTNLHTHTASGTARYFNQVYHIRFCTYCDGRIYDVHTPNNLNVCTGCGATGPFFIPLEP